MESIIGHTSSNKFRDMSSFCSASAVFVPISPAWVIPDRITASGKAASSS